MEAVVVADPLMLSERAPVWVALSEGVVVTLPDAVTEFSSVIVALAIADGDTVSDALSAPLTDPDGVAVAVAD